MHTLPSTRWPPMFAVIAGINFTLFLVQLSMGMAWLRPDPKAMIAMGASLAPLTLLGEPWRLFSSMFLHAGVIHIGINMYFLIAVGGLIERAFGRVRFTLAYLLAGLAGSLFSALWHSRHKEPIYNLLGQEIGSRLHIGVSVGASGALIGICAAYLAYWLVHGSPLPQSTVSFGGQQAQPVIPAAAAPAISPDGPAGTLGTGDSPPTEEEQQKLDAITVRGPLIQTIGLTLLLGALMPGTDNAAHIGGLLAGVVLGTAFGLTRFERQHRKRRRATVLIALAGMAAVWLGLKTPPSKELLELRRQMDERARYQLRQTTPGAAALESVRRLGVGARGLEQ